MSIVINNISVNGAGAANDIGAASGADTGAKLKTLIGTTDAELLQLENIVASGLDAIANGPIYARTTISGAANAEAIANASGATVADRLLTLVKTVDGVGSGLDADLLDGKNLATTSASGVVVGTLSTGKIDNSFLNNATTTVSGIMLLGASGGAIKMATYPDAGYTWKSGDALTGWTSLYGSAPVANNGNVRTTGLGTSANLLLKNTLITTGNYIVSAKFVDNANAIAPIVYRPYPSNFKNLTFTRLGGYIYVDFELAYIQTAYATFFSIGFVFADAAAQNGQVLEMVELSYAPMSYNLPGTVLTKSATAIKEIVELDSSTIIGKKALARLLSTGTNITASDYIIILDNRYTWVDTLTPTEGQILKGTDAAESLENLKLGIIEGSGGANYGVKHYVAMANPLVTATHTTGSLFLDLVALAEGELYNKISLTKFSTNLTWFTASMYGGYSKVADQIHSLNTKGGSKYFYGKKFTSFGDSITAGELWQPAIATRFGFLHTNCGLGSSSVGGASTTPARFWEDSRINAVKAADPDILTILGGANDWSYHIPLGTPDTEFTANLASKDKTTFYGAYSFIIETLLAWKPALRIFILTTTRGNTETADGTTGLYIRDYSEACRVIGKRYGLPVVDLRGEMGLNDQTASLLLTDTIHPNTTGAKRISTLVSSAILDNLGDTSAW